MMMMINNWCWFLVSPLAVHSFVGFFWSIDFFCLVWFSQVFGCLRFCFCLQTAHFIIFCLQILQPFLGSTFSDLFRDSSVDQCHGNAFVVLRESVSFSGRVVLRNVFLSGNCFFLCFLNVFSCGFGSSFFCPIGPFAFVCCSLEFFGGSCCLVSPSLSIYVYFSLPAGRPRGGREWVSLSCIAHKANYSAGTPCSNAAHPFASSLSVSLSLSLSLLLPESAPSSPLLPVPILALLLFFLFLLLLPLLFVVVRLLPGQMDLLGSM